MEDQGKRLLLAVALSLGIVLLWQVMFPPEKPRPKRAADPAAEVVEPSKESPVGAPLEGAVPAAPAGTEETFAFAFDDFEATFSNKDGRLVSWRLTNPKYLRDPNRGELVGSQELGSFAVNFYKSPAVIPAGAFWKGERLSDKSVAFTWDDANVVVRKTFTLHPDDYLLTLAVEVEGKRELKQQLALSITGRQDPKADKGGGMGQVTKELRAACHLNGSLAQLGAPRLLDEGPTERGGTVRWIGFNHPYFFIGVAPRAGSAGREELLCNTYPIVPVEGGVQGGMRIDLVFQQAKLTPDAPGLKKEVVAYLGPKFLEKLERASDVAGFSTGFESTMDMGWFSFLAEPLLSLLTWLHGLVGSWGLSIVLLTVLVKLATLYWTTKSMRSMKAMAALKPRVDELQKKYGDDRAKVQQEMMALYKQHGVNPLSGCLPMLLQMPIWFALYRMLSSVGELYQEPLVTGWIDDLTATDPFHVLPAALVGLMFLQARLTPATGDGMQQKILMYGLPLMFGVMSFFFPAGLTIYILTNTGLSILHSLYMKRFDGAPQGARGPAARPREEASRPARGAEAATAQGPQGEPEAREDGEENDAGDEADTETQDNATAAAGSERRTKTSRRKRKRKH